MDDHHLNRLSVTPSVERQTPRNEFGNVLKSALQSGAAVAGSVGGSLLNGIPGGAIVSAAVSSVTALASHGGGVSSASRAATGAVPVGGAGVNTVAQSGTASAGTNAVDPGQANVGSFNDMLQQMRAESDKSIVMQMQMQQESRDYNTISNVLKTRHDSAKSAINNIR